MAVHLPECERNIGGALRQGADFVFVEDVQQKSDFNTGSVDGCDCAERLNLIAGGKHDTKSLLTHTYVLAKIDELYALFKNKCDGVNNITVILRWSVDINQLINKNLVDIVYRRL